MTTFHPIPKVSKAQAVKNKLIAKAVRLWRKTLGDDPRCSLPGCRRRAEKSPHHILPRSARKDLEVDPENFLAVCWDHHAEIHRRPAWSYINGYMGRTGDDLKELAERRKAVNE